LWKFSPTKLGNYNEKVSLAYWNENHSELKGIADLRLLGSCISGSLNCTETYKDLGTCVVGDSILSQLIVVNNFDCNLNFRVEAFSLDKDENAVYTLELEKSILNIKARSKMPLNFRFRPNKSINYQFVIYYEIINLLENNNSICTQSNNDSHEKNLSDKSKEILGYIIANSVYPKLRVIDVNGLGTASSINKSYLWRMLNINKYGFILFILYISRNILFRYYFIFFFFSLLIYYYYFFSKA
jgi:hypothetical protein